MKKDIMVIRESIGRIVSMLTNQAIKVTQRGSRAHVSYHPKSGKITGMNIPFIPDDASDEFVAAIQGFLDHEVGHVLYSDSKSLLASVKDGKRVMNLANIIEDVFVERKMTAAFQGSGANLESVRKFYLEKIARTKIEDALARGATEEAQGYASVVAFRAWGGQTSAMDFIKEPKIAALVEPVATKLGPELIAEIGKCNNSHECLALARKYKAKLEVPKPPPPPPEPKDMLDSMDGEKDLSDALETDKKEDPEDEGTSHTEADDSGKTGAEKSAPLKDDSDDEGEAGDSTGHETSDKETTDEDAEEEEDPDKSELDGAADDTTKGDVGDDAGIGTEAPDADAPESTDAEGKGADTASAESGDAIAGGDDTHSAPDPDIPESEPDPIADLFDTSHDFDKDMAEHLSDAAKTEIDEADYAVFSTEWDRIEPGPLALSPHSVERMEAGIRDKVGVMQKMLERAVSAQDRKCWSPGQSRGRIAPGALFKTAVGDDRVFRQRFETKAKNTAVSLVVDCSGSMSGERIELAGIAAYGLSCVLERLRITHEVIGFTTAYSAEMMSLMTADARHGERSTRDMNWGRVEPLYMPVFKSFSGKLDGAARSRMAHLTERVGWLSQNVDGESVQVAARRLLQQKAQRHIMIVLSDGDPACLSGKGQRPHLKRIVKSLTTQGVEVIGIGIQTNSVKNYYPKNVVLSNVDELPTRVMAELSKLLLAV